MYKTSCRRVINFKIYRLIPLNLKLKSTTFPLLADNIHWYLWLANDKVILNY